MEISKNTLQIIGNLFRLPGEVKSFTEVNDGTSNSSYEVNYNTNKKYIFQRVRFTQNVEPESVMKNVDLVTRHLVNKNLVALHFHHTNYNENYIVHDGEYWRVLKYFEFNRVECNSDEVVENIGRAIASFQAALADFDHTQLIPTFVDRHNTKKYFDEVNEMTGDEAEYIKTSAAKASRVFEAYLNGEIPTRVVHNHSKVQNVLFDRDLKNPIVMIDLDSVTQGISLYDFATTAMSACKIEGGKVFDLSKFEAYLKGYLSVAKSFLTEKEVDLLADSVYAMAVEASAFNLLKYRDGEKERRLAKCRLYIEFSKDIESKLDAMRELVVDCNKNVVVKNENWNSFERDVAAQTTTYKAGQYMDIVMPHKVTPRKGKAYLFFKRAFDIVASLLALTVFSPILLIVGLLVKLTSKGPMIYVSKRVGQNGRIFNFYKFRSMYQDAESRLEELLSKNEVEGGITFKMKNDPRITPFGRFIRRTSLDELPQLVNILIGDMTLIGPRVGLPREVEQYPQEALDRLLVPQGLSGEWQANGRSDTTFDQMIKMDLDYIQNKRSFWHDIGLIFKTVWVVIAGRGAE